MVTMKTGFRSMPQVCYIITKALTIVFKQPAGPGNSSTVHPPLGKLNNLVGPKMILIDAFVSLTKGRHLQTTVRCVYVNYTSALGCMSQFPMCNAPNVHLNTL